MDKIAREESFGEARTATEEETNSNCRSTNGLGINLGWYFGNGKIGQRITYGSERHLLLFGPNGSGKGTRFLLANLLGTSLLGRSIIAIDPKGELAAVSAKHQHEQGQDVKVLDPFGVLEKIVNAQPDLYRYLIDNGIAKSVGFNPLDSLAPASPEFYDDAAGLGEALIKIEGKDPHWTESAQGLEVGCSMWEKLENGANATLGNVRAMLTQPDVWEDYVGDDGKKRERLVSGLRVTARKMIEKGGFEIASLAGRFTQRSDEIASIISTADTQTRWMLSAPVRTDIGKSGLDFAQLKKRPTTVYVILPAERLRTHSVWLRLVIVSALRALYQPGGLRTVLFIDEMAALGHLAPLEDAFGLVRGYRVQIVGIFQDLGQLQALYKERWETFVANAGAVMGFAPNDLTTAEWMSRRSGTTTGVAKGFNENSGTSTGGHGSVSAGSGMNYQQFARPLFLPHDLMGMEEGSGLLWLAGLANAVPFFAPPYWKILECSKRALPNPYYFPA